MRVASFGLTTTGGAGLSTLKLHRALLNADIDSRLYTLRECSGDKIYQIKLKELFSSRSWALGTVPVAKGTYNIVSSGYSAAEENFLNEIYSWADLILLRWVTSVVSDFTITRWAHSNKPVVWCLSDMAPITGGCHYSGDCTKYETDCDNCPKVAKTSVNVPSITLQRRQKFWKNLTIVSPSRWLAECSRNSVATRNNDIRVIQTGVELDVFKPRDRIAAKRKIGLNPEKFALLFGAQSAKDPRKGYRFLEAAARRLSKRTDIEVLIVGEADRDILKQIPFRTIATGHVDGREDLSNLYSAADITVIPYVEDNLPNVMLESIASGTPVIAFGVGGIKDVLLDNVNGMNAIPFDDGHLAYCIEALLAKPLSQSKVRQFAIENLDLGIQTAKYINLFNELLADKKHDIGR